jgi:signal peptidase II
VTTTAVGRRWLIFVVLGIVVVAVDQLTKAWVAANVAPGQAIEIAGDALRIVHGRNTGGIFGLFGDSATLLGLASTVVIAIIVVYMAREGTRSHWLLTVALGFLIGGAVGNLIDRLLLGHVIDWVDAGLGDMRWYTFNVADSAISVALVLLVVLALVGDRLGSADHAAAGAPGT